MSMFLSSEGLGEYVNYIRAKSVLHFVETSFKKHMANLKNALKR